MEETESKRPLEDPEEQAHFKQVVSAFFNYTVTAKKCKIKPDYTIG